MYNGAGTQQRWYAYGNYIDEVLIKGTSYATSSFQYYLHDHLYSPVAITSWSGAPAERYEYDAYGNPHILEPDCSPDPDGKSDCSNSYLFTGRELDIFDSGSLKIQYNRNRYYDSYTGRWTTHDPAGYIDGLNLYQYVQSAPTNSSDVSGLSGCNWCERLFCTWRLESHTPSYYWCMPVAFPIVCNSCAEFGCFSVGTDRSGCYFRGKRCDYKIRSGKQHFHGYGTFCVSGCVAIKVFRASEFRDILRPPGPGTGAPASVPSENIINASLTGGGRFGGMEGL